MTLLSECGTFRQAWRRALDAMNRTDLTDLEKNDEMFYSLDYALAKIQVAGLPDFKPIDFAADEVHERDKRVRFALEKVSNIDLNWTVQEFIERLKDDAGNYLFHNKIEKRVQTDDRIAPGGVAAAFDSTKFQDSGALNELISRLRRFSDAWNATKYYAPYFPVLNSSMVGKSRLLNELPNRGIFTFTICLRNETDMEYRPPRSKEIADWAVRDEKDPRIFTRESCAFLESTLDLFLEWLQNREKKVPFAEITKAWDTYCKTNQTDIWKTLYNKFSGIPVSDSLATLAKTLDLIITKSSKRILEKASLINQCLSDAVADYSNEDVIPLFVFVIDEAKQLKLSHDSTNGLTLFRRSLRALPSAVKRECRFFCIMSDTASKISNFSPSAELSDSARMVHSHLLFPPYTVVDSIDVWADKARFTQVAEGSSSEEMLLQMRKLCIDDNLIQNELAAIPDKPKVFLYEVITMELAESYEFMATFGRAGFYAHLIGKKLHPLSPVGPDDLNELLQVKILRRLCNSSKRLTQDDEDAIDFRSKRENETGG